MNKRLIQHITHMFLELNPSDMGFDYDEWFYVKENQFREEILINVPFTTLITYIQKNVDASSQLSRSEIMDHIRSVISTEEVLNIVRQTVIMHRLM